MSIRERLEVMNRRRQGKPLSATKIIAVGFVIVIAVGTLLLCLPAASRNGESCGILAALFTATSATCVTGLSLFDSYSQWSGFGQGVILSLIEIGGLGFMSAATLVVFLMKRKVGLKHRMMIAQAFSVSDMDGVVRLQKTVLVGSLGIETIGAAILTLRFWPEYGFGKALKWGVFHSVSAFCNAGFDIFGELEPGSSLMLFQSDAIVLVTLAALIVVGGLGFVVWEELAGHKKNHPFTVYTRLVLFATWTLILFGWVVLCALEWNNPGTFGSLSIKDKLLGGLFQSVTLRTAGFSAIDQGAMTESGKVVSMILMLIGGSSGSTAGGLKTVTFLVLVLFIRSRARGVNSVCVYQRTIPDSQVLDAVTIAIIMIVLAVFGGMVICSSSGVSFTDALFESVSALATVGLTTGVTGALTTVGKFLIIIYMYFGRVGVLTISLGFLMGSRAQERFRYAETSLLIG